MNLPVLHERVDITEDAENEFRFRLSKEVWSKCELTLDKCIEILSQCILNLNSDNKMIKTEYQEQVEKLLDEISEKYELTYGEKVKILASRLLDESKYVIRWERHRNLNKEGDWA
ncbi:MAG: hypothetical protein N4A40_12510 [Tissierellales bacterium]|jgi:hypothetical protein|nr:hypothetical protein [Tissierellales bacterium]